MDKTVLLKEVATVKLCIVSPPKDKDNREHLFWLTAANLQSDNTISVLNSDDKFDKDSKLEIYNEDIIIKRINPQFINLITNISQETYASNNLFIVRTEKIDTKYLAFVLSNTIKQISEHQSVGSVIPSLGRKEVEEIPIPLIPIEMQKALGNLWLTSLAKRTLKNKLTELEYKKENYLMTRYIIGENR